MERVLYNIHSQVCGAALRRTSGKTRRLLEYVVLLGGVCGFSVLFVSHVSFVYRDQRVRAIPHMCLASIPGFNPTMDVTHVQILSDSRRDSSSYAIQQPTMPAMPSLLQSDNNSENNPNQNQSCIASSKEQFLHTINNATIQFSFSKTRGFLLVPSETLLQHNISTQLVSVSKTDTHCFGEPFLQRIVFGVVGTDTVVMNWLLILGDGFLYNPRTQILQESFSSSSSSLHQQNDQPNSTSSRITHLSLWKTVGFTSWIRILLEKVGVVVTSIFLFFITTTLTSFTLRETQQRMLEFTIQLQTHVRQERLLGRLIFVHVMENLVFCPIMVGMMFFLIEFYGGDKVLAFMVLSLVWIAEVFSVVSLRSQEGLRFFPRIFFLLFLVYHVYLFSCPHGFAYTALASMVAFLLHSMLFFWNRYELPAVAHGFVTLQRPRMDPSTAITSSSPEQQLLMPRLEEPPVTTALPVATTQQQQPPIILEPRPPQRQQSNHSMSTLGRSTADLSRLPSGLFQDEDEEDSCLYMLGGEVVMHRRRSLSPSSLRSSATNNNNNETTTPRRRATSASDDQIPLEVETSSPSNIDGLHSFDSDLTPRIGSSTTPRSHGRGPAFPF
mmetsp:Transcript_8475/g.14034  ORF Transcript_8475/g.14034 Transcript_8475/m.14034 type:complete len:610 (+) Transcript_8475:20-1849(+)